MAGEGAQDLPEELKGMITAASEEDATEFVNFDGDFDGECIDESVKINLNAFYGLNPMQNVGEGYNSYDKFKIDLAKFLGKEAYQPLFEELDIKVGDVVRNLGDWVDTNEMINEIGAVEAGPETALYERLNVGYPVKNSKLTSMDEAYLIDGIIDEWFNPLRKYFTIYGDGKVNVCTAEEIVIQDVIRRYVEDNPNLPPVKLDDPETMAKLVMAVYDGCGMGGIGNQLKQQIADSLNAALGALEETPTEAGATPAAAASGFAALLATEPRYFSLYLTGAVGDVTVRIHAVLDVKDANPQRWTLLYWRVY
jgi:type II secretory pathway component PulK